MLTLIFCIASGIISSIVVYSVAKPPSHIQSVSVAFSNSNSTVQCDRSHEIFVQKAISHHQPIQMNVARSQVEQCIDTYCVLCRHPIFIDAMLCIGFNWMEVRVDNSVMVQMRVEMPGKEIDINNKNG